MFIYSMVAMVPTIFECLVITAFIVWLLRKAYTHFKAEGVTPLGVLSFVDPHKQSFLYFQYNWLNIPVLIILTYLLYRYAASIQLTAEGYVPSSIFNNILVYLQNYLIHESGHNFWGRMLGVTQREGWGFWWVALNGNLTETLVPIILFWLVIRVKGGHLFAAPFLYWISTTFYGAGIYAADARASMMQLVSSDMVSNFAAGTKGDWYYILGPLNLLPYDIIISRVFMFFAALTFVLALYSVYFYFKDLATAPLYKDDGKTFHYTPPDNYQAQPAQEDNPPSPQTEEYPNLWQGDAGQDDGRTTLPR